MKKKLPEKPISKEKMQLENDKLFEFLQSQTFESIEEINAFLNQHVNGKKTGDIVPAKKGRKSNIEKSNDLMYQAYDSSDKKGKKLAQEALKLNPNNIRAITYIANHETNAEIALNMYETAIEIGRKQLGDIFFKENKGQFWIMHETRPFMTAKLRHAECLFALNKIDESIKEYFEILELNEYDNQGVRYYLQTMLLKNKRFDDYIKLRELFPEENSTFWLFNHALYTFVTKGESKETNKALDIAVESNKHVLYYMTGKKKFKNESLDYYSPGDESEATIYLKDNIAIWIEFPDTLHWIQKYMMKFVNLN
jgi:hypothetical protein